MAKKLLAHEYFKAPPFDVLLDAERYKGHWRDRFGRTAPLHVEIGMGLGRHLVEFARRHPEMNHVGLEMKMHRIYTARNKALRQGIKNVRFIPGDALHGMLAFAPGEVGRLTLLFPDPWPLPKDEPKRLTSPSYVTLYKELLGADGVMHFRTDDPDLFHYSCKTFADGGFSLAIAVPCDRILTDFEQRWLGVGRQIYAFDATANTARASK